MIVISIYPLKRKEKCEKKIVASSVERIWIQVPFAVMTAETSRKASNSAPSLSWLVSEGLMIIRELQRRIPAACYIGDNILATIWAGA